MKTNVKQKTFGAVALMVLGTVLSGTAYASDLSLKDTAYEGRSVDWTGAYIGLHGGWAGADSTTTDDIKDWCGPYDDACIKKYVGPFDHSPNGFLAGGTVGYNWQIDNHFLIGVEGDLGYMNLDGTTEISSSQDGKHQDLTISDGLYGVAAIRAGLTFERLLVYGKGGFAYFDGGSSQKTTAKGFETNETDAFSGLAYGGGIEYMLTQNVSLKVEYLRFDFDSQGGDQTDISEPNGYVFDYKTDVTVDTVKLGLNYRF